ncbi:MAG: hypothetical protein P4M15_12480 [Alphaproteobacteria bacterium]|nr:hypothetical protein [Alphaproteobacteria bacterium]
MMKIGDPMKKLGLGKALGALDRIGSDGGRSSAAASSGGASISESSNSMMRALMGSVGVIGDFYFPADVIGGTCPRIAGDEEEIVWNAAAEACDTERVHVVWQSFESRIWYLAVRSQELASQANSWCPFASLLPAMKDAAMPPVCYTYFGEEVAAMMIVTTDGLQIFRGTSPIVRAKAERTARELGNAPIINLDSDRIEALTPTPWYSLSLFESRARRILATLSVLMALFVTGFSFLVYLTASMSLVASQHNLAEALSQTQDKSMALMAEVEKTRSSPMRDQIGEFLRINDGLLALNGFLNVYEIKDGSKARWRATVPPSATADRIQALGGMTLETDDQGNVAIGNMIEKQFELKQKEKR